MANVNTRAMERAIKSIKDEETICFIYELDKTAYELWKTAKLNTDLIWDNNPEMAEIGYKAYWDLKNYIRKNDMCDDVLVDLAADFSWDGRLSAACERFDAEYSK